MQRERKLLLLDNGSLEPAATQSLRRLAVAMAQGLGREVEPVSLLHSNKVPEAQLGGRPAEILVPYLKRLLAEGVSDFDIVPLFFGPSGALTEYLPARIAALQAGGWPALSVRIAPCLAESMFPGDDTLSSLLADNLAVPLAECALGAPTVILVDHGSPKREVTAVRNMLASALRARLGSRVRAVLAASMERRPEPEFDFNEPLLERALAALPPEAGEIVLSLLFASPGRHAGPGGDIARICEAACALRPGLRVRISPLVGEHPGLVSLLIRRAQDLALTS